MNRTILLLGGSRFALPVIEAAHKLDAKVITCDYLPNNIAHSYSDGYENVSIVDKEAILDVAMRLKIDGIMSFACDPGVLTAAYVAEKMGLPSPGSYKSVSILQNKGKFRDYLESNGFNVPKHLVFKKDDISPSKLMREFAFPFIIKPVDSAGSKGVTKVQKEDNLNEAIDRAFQFSLSDELIVEEFLESKGDPSDSECFSLEGKMVFASWSAQKFDPKCGNPYAPAGFTWVPSISEANRLYLDNELARLIKLLGMKTALYNVEARETKQGKAYLMEVSPRGGGNRLAEMVKKVYGVDLIEMAVQAALGDSISQIEFKEKDEGWTELILHSRKGGVFKGISIDASIEKHVKEIDLWVHEGELIDDFSGANKAIGTLVLHFDDKAQLDRVMKNPYDYVSVTVL